MKATTRHYIDFTQVEGFFHGCEVRQVETRDIGGVKDSDWPERAFCFKFFDRTVTTTEDGEELLGKPKNYSSVYYHKGAKLLNAEDIRNGAMGDGDHEILLSNMKGNDWNQVVLTKFGNCQPAGEGVIILE